MLSYWIIILFGLVLLTLFFCFVPLPYPRFFPDYNLGVDFNKYELYRKAPWATVYLSKDKSHIMKQISAPGVSHTDYSHIWLPTFNRKIAHQLHITNIGGAPNCTKNDVKELRTHKNPS